MIIRDYRPEDFIQIKELWKLTNIYVSERGDTPEVIQRCNAMNGKLLVMEDPASGILIGTSWMTYDGRRLFLHHFAINPSHQRKGFGPKGVCIHFRQTVYNLTDFIRVGDHPLYALFVLIPFGLDLQMSGLYLYR